MMHMHVHDTRIMQTLTDSLCTCTIINILTDYIYEVTNRLKVTVSQ